MSGIDSSDAITTTPTTGRKIAFIGLGIMGRPMAGHLLAAGHRVTVFNRTKSKADPLIAAGATFADTPAVATANADVVFICVSDTPDVAAVLFGDGDRSGERAGHAADHSADDAIAKTIRPGTIVVDHSTISPVATRRFAERLAKQGVTLIDAPVSGGDAGARNATLSVMCGGPRAAFDAVRPLLAHLGKTITYCGESGQGQATKLINQVLVLGTLSAVCEAMMLAKSGGLDPATTLAAVGGGAAASWQLANLWPKIAAADFAPGFRVDLALKDLRLVEEYAAAAGITLPNTHRLRGLYETLAHTGHATDGTQALFLAASPGASAAT